MRARTVAAVPLTKGEYYDLQNAWEAFWSTDSGSDEELEALEGLIEQALLARYWLRERKALSGD